MTGTLTPQLQSSRVEASGVLQDPPLKLERSHFLASISVLFIFFSVYQTLVQTVLTDDAVRKGLNVDESEMIWQQVGYAVGLMYGVFTGMWLAARIGGRYTIALGLLGFALGNLLCGAAVNLESFVLGRFVDGFGKTMVMIVCRRTLYRQFDRMILVAIGFYGVVAYSTRNMTPLVQAEVLEQLSWRWMYWYYIPFALLAMFLVAQYFRPDRPPKPIRVPIDWFAVTLFIAWLVAILFAFGWYRKWGGWTSNEFAVTSLLCVTFPIVLVAWLGSGYSPDEHLKRLLRSRVVVLSTGVRGLMLTQMVGVLTIVGMYATELREYPRTTAGWLIVPTAVTMAASTFLTTWFHQRSLRHVWLVVAMLGTAACVWWMSSINNFTSKEQLALMLACWGAFLGLIPPAFLTDEVEGVSPADALYAGSLGIVALVVPILTVPTATGTAIKAASDRAFDSYRLDLSRNRPAVPEAAVRIADYYHQRGLTGPELESQTGKVLGTFAGIESAAYGFRVGLRFFSLMMLTLGLGMSALLWEAASKLRAPPGSGYS